MCVLLVCSASAYKMDARIVELAILSLFFIVLSNQAAIEENSDFLCPLEDHPKYVDHRVEHDIRRTVKCVNGRNMAGCCVPRQYCDFNTSYTDLSLYGSPGYRTTCKNVCCPQKYLLPIPLPNTTATSPIMIFTKEDDDDSSMDPDDNSVDDD